MSSFTSDLTTNIENSRNTLRRIARHDDQEFSNQSIINMMEKFVKTVNVMDDTILIPCRLMDRQVGDSTDTVSMPTKSHHHGHSSHHHSHHHHHHHHGKKKPTVQESLNAAELFNLYNMLNMVKTDLLWGRNHDINEEQQTAGTVVPAPPQTKQQVTETTTTPSSQQTISTTKTSEEVSMAPCDNSSVKGHVRRPSTVSMSSSNSASTISDDSESEISNENDSGIESENQRNLDKSQDLAKQFRSHLNGLFRTLEQMTDAANYLTARYQSDVGQV